MNVQKNVNRDQWKSQLGFIFAALGTAIGLGNVWRFPYLVYENGGGAFLIPYLIALFTCGIPLVILEFAIGHERVASTPMAFAKISRRWEWTGWLAIFFVFLGIQLYYCVIISWCLNYFSFAFNLGWGDNPEQFFNSDYLNKSSSPSEFGTLQVSILIALAIIWAINWFVIHRGVSQGIEKANKIFIPLLVLFIFILLFWTIFLEGAWDGIMLYLTPNFETILQPKVWIAAYSQIFFTLSIGFGVLITYASYLPKKSNLTRSALITGILNSSFSLVAGIVVFSGLGFMAQAKGVPVQEVVKGGIGLAFVVYPEIFNTIAASFNPFIASILGVIFFLILIIAGLSSSISIVESLTSGLVDKFQWNRKIINNTLCIMGFFGSLIYISSGGLYYLDIVDYFISQYGLLLIGLLQCIIGGWVFKASILRFHLNQVSSLNLPPLWEFIIRFFNPFVLILIMTSALYKVLTEGYGGYSTEHLLIFGLFWIVVSFVLSFVFSQKPWKIDLKNHYSRSQDYQNIS